MAPRLTLEQREEIIKQFIAGEITPAEAMRLTGVSRSTFYNNARDVYNGKALKDGRTDRKPRPYKPRKNDI